MRETALREIWFDSDGFNRYRGTGWMKEPCASCDQRELDLGGCRCQAYLIANDPAAADPVCHKSPHHHLITDITARAREGTVQGDIKPVLFYRDDETSRRLSAQGKKTTV